MTQKFNGKEIVVVAALAVVAGLVGGWLFVALANWYLRSFDLVGTAFPERIGPDSKIIIQGARQVVVDQDKQTADVIANAQKYLVGFYDTKATNFDLDTAVGQGLVLTGDGWLLARLDSAAASADQVKNFKVVVADKGVFAVDQAVLDKTSGLWLVKVNAQGLTVAPMSLAKNISLGQVGVALGWRSGATVSNVSRWQWPKIRSSDQPAEVFTTAVKATSGQFLLLGLSGQVIGLASSNGWSAVDNLLAGLNSFVANKTLARPVLGVYYEALSDQVNPAGGRGALLVKNGSEPAVIKGSPAAGAGLLAGDIILSVNSQELNADNDLAMVIFSHKPREKIYLHYKRGQQEHDIDVILAGSQPD